MTDKIVGANVLNSQDHYIINSIALTNAARCKLLNVRLTYFHTIALTPFSMLSIFYHTSQYLFNISASV